MIIRLTTYEECMYDARPPRLNQPKRDVLFGCNYNDDVRISRKQKKRQKRWSWA